LHPLKKGLCHIEVDLIWSIAVSMFPDGVAHSTDELVHAELGLGFCKGYIEAHAEELGLAGKVCLTTDNKPDQLIAVVKKYLADHPELWDKPAMWLVRDALAQAFPCSK
jgi:hypothetical protein